MICALRDLDLANSTAIPPKINRADLDRQWYFGTFEENMFLPNQIPDALMKRLVIVSTFYRLELRPVEVILKPYIARL